MISDERFCEPNESCLGLQGVEGAVEGSEWRCRFLTRTAWTLPFSPVVRASNVVQNYHLDLWTILLGSFFTLLKCYWRQQRHQIALFQDINRIWPTRVVHKRQRPRHEFFSVESSKICFFWQIAWFCAPGEKTSRETSLWGGTKYRLLMNH